MAPPRVLPPVQPPPLVPQFEHVVPFTRTLPPDERGGAGYTILPKTGYEPFATPLGPIAGQREPLTTPTGATRTTGYPGLPPIAPTAPQQPDVYSPNLALTTAKRLGDVRAQTALQKAFEGGPSPEWLNLVQAHRGEIGYTYSGGLWELFRNKYSYAQPENIVKYKGWYPGYQAPIITRGMAGGDNLAPGGGGGGRYAPRAAGTYGYSNSPGLIMWRIGF